MENAVATWKISTEHKKSVTQIEYWKNMKTNQKITWTLGWRWGEYFVEAPEDTTIEEFLECYDEDDGISIFEDFEIIDSSEDDGWFADYEFSGMTEEEEQAMLDFLEENSLMDLEGDDWICEDSETILTGPLNIELVKDDD